MDETTLRNLADLESIRDLARRYAHCVWQKDADGAIDLFTDDAVMDMGDRPAIKGREALLETYRETFAANVFLPFVHNHVIEIDGDQAEGTVYLDLRSVDDGKPMTGHGYYKDRYRRVGDGWKFTYRLLTLVEYREA
ncbi:MAG: nuclear transport factor 2 family protein [bacterium]|nr:nuclear transport factor 2 family protein [bacterium]